MIYLYVIVQNIHMDMSEDLWPLKISLVAVSIRRSWYTLVWQVTCALCLLPLQWRHNERDGVSNHQRIDCSLNRLFRHRSKKTPKLRVTGLREGNSLVTGEFPTQRLSNTGNISIWWRHHDVQTFHLSCMTKAMPGIKIFFRSPNGLITIMPMKRWLDGWR